MRDRSKNTSRKKARTRYTAADWFVGIWVAAGLAVAAVGIWNLIGSF